MKVKKVEKTDDSKRTAEKAKRIIKKLSLTVVIVAILTTLGIFTYKTYFEGTPLKESDTTSQTSDKKENDDQLAYEASSENTDNAETPEPTEKSENAEIKVANIDKFYEAIIAGRQEYGHDFADVFQSKEDIEDFVNFINGFNPFEKQTSKIRSLEEFTNIIDNYYSSCIRHNVKPELSTILVNNEAMHTLLEESESLAYNVVKTSGDDYKIANEYYVFLGETLVDGQKSPIDFGNRNNSPYIYILLRQYGQYRNTGNMLAARKNQKVYDISINGSTEFACPNAIDNFLISDIDFGEIPTYNTILDYIEEECNNSLERN